MFSFLFCKIFIALYVRCTLDFIYFQRRLVPGYEVLLGTKNLNFQLTCPIGCFERVELLGSSFAGQNILYLYCSDLTGAIPCVRVITEKLVLV